MNAKNESWEWVKALGIALVLAILIRTFFFAPFVVDGDSMEPNLHNGEWLIVNKLTYRFSEPERGDIIVFHFSEDKDYIKRVIGLPGETVSIEDGNLYINGEQVDEPYLDEAKEKYNKYGDIPYTEDFSEVTVPEGEIFVMGDNRPRSQDSRYSQVGTIELERVVGRADVVLWPLQSFGVPQ